ncbi:MAG: DNA-directed RNA polymerase subunit omega [Ignavibacteriaceae bacterium]|jgi:DNA-directed RNA polymerase omega subunit|nr:DNA-directed RNA polymerase subunit omega [Ignavibacteriaceae bacterium]
MEITPVDLREIDKKAANVYEAIIVAAKRARQINDEIKIAYNAQISTIPVSANDDDSEDIMNPAQMKISMEFEKREKPHIDAINELLAGKIEFEYKK